MSVLEFTVESAACAVAFVGSMRSIKIMRVEKIVKKANAILRLSGLCFIIDCLMIFPQNIRLAF